jgi:4-hydroxy-2-oxoheptanedioate aldolase
MTLRELFDEGGVTIGGWCAIPSAFSAELMGRFGWDWVCVDMQHGLIGYDQAASMLQALSITKTPALVRVPWNQPDYIMKMLDAGAQGIIVPMVGTAEQARQAVEAVKYPPLGSRSWGPIRASLDLQGYNPQVANDHTVLAAMIETVEGVENMDEIMAVEGVDAIYVGPSDLGLTHGMTTSQSPEPGSAHDRLILDILAACNRNNVVPGIHTDSIETALRRREAGFRMITVMSDALLLRKAANEAITSMRGQVLPPPATTPGSSYA